MPDQYKVPQNLDVEDKIIGPFTLKQFGFLVGGVLLIYVLYTILMPMFGLMVVMIVDAPVAVLTIAIVFVKINERPFLTFLAFLLGFVKNPKTMKWQKASKLKDFGTMVKASSEEKEKQKEMAKLARSGVVRSRLNELALTLDTKGWNAESNETEGRVASPGVVQSALRENVKADTNLTELPLD
ncbi:MAG TPA: PrgI family protein [Patescibacteria group bacterium]|nr:PrgI family protein [Patescibacteria group bacterium]